MFQFAIRLLGIIHAPWFTIPYLIVEAQEESVTFYQWPDGSVHKKPWKVTDTKMQALADLEYKRQWGDEAVDMTMIKKINRYL